VDGSGIERDVEVAEVPYAALDARPIIVAAARARRQVECVLASRAPLLRVAPLRYGQVSVSARSVPQRQLIGSVACARILKWSALNSRRCAEAPVPILMVARIAR